MLNLDHFFFLKKFAHRALWQEEASFWFPLVLLDEYLEKISHTIEIEIPSGVYLSNVEKISIGKGTVLEPGVFIQGPCIIGKNCTIRHGAFLRDGVVLGNDCSIGHSAEIKHSILLNSVHATHFCYVGDSILGNSVNLGAGVKCANLRLDRKCVRVNFENKKIKTGLKKLGAIVGDKVQIGCNCVLNPGTLLGRESIVYPLLNVGGFIPSHSSVISDNSWRVQPKILHDLLGEMPKIVSEDATARSLVEG